jgi:phosphonopyruvate decarboxylase
VAQNENETCHIITANEGNAIGLAAGYHLATGNISLVYLQVTTG